MDTFTKEKYLIALDASSITIGYALFNIETRELKVLSYYQHDKNKTLIERVIDYQNLLKNLMSEYYIVEMIIEQSLEGFAAGMSSAHTLNVLASINFGYQLISHQAGLKVSTITSQESRKYALPGLRLKSKKASGGINHKEQVFNYLLPLLGEKYFNSHTKTISKGKNKGAIVFEDYCKDMSDSWVVGAGYLNKCDKVKLA